MYPEGGQCGIVSVTKKFRLVFSEAPQLRILKIIANIRGPLKCKFFSSDISVSWSTPETKYPGFQPDPSTEWSTSSAQPAWVKF